MLSNSNLSHIPGDLNNIQLTDIKDINELWFPEIHHI